jgi:hypothetical protein
MSGVIIDAPAIATTAELKASTAMTSEGQEWDLMQRKAKVYAMSPLVPEHIRKPEGAAVANCLIALEMSKLLDESPLIVMQNIYIVKGKAGFSAQYMVARANKSGLFRDPIDWDSTGKGDDLAITAYTVMKGTDKRIEFTVSMAMAKAEGWTSNPKYKSMPELMLRYRSATFLVRLYCPQVMLGMHTADEIEDVEYSVDEVAQPPAISLAAPKMPTLESTPELKQETHVENPDSEPAN